MPEIRDTEPDVFATYMAMEVTALHVALDALKHDPQSYRSGRVEEPLRFADFTDDALTRTIAITRALRKKAAAPGVSRAKAPAKPRSAKASLESLA